MLMFFFHKIKILTVGIIFEIIYMYTIQLLVVKSNIKEIPMLLSNYETDISNNNQGGKPFDQLSKPKQEALINTSRQKNPTDSKFQGKKPK